ncbi:MAG: inorganic diphosphatase [Actinomycetes bacterium]|jgi:inorganic pyrophosphatase|nr:MAG: inorganic diphosphatase [Actinomycetota bacterium]
MDTPLVAVVEIPGGSRNKYEIDKETGEIFLDRTLFTATRYPADYGYFPETLAEDGDPLDVLVLVTEPTFPGCRVRVRPIGAFLMEDDGDPDHKVIAVPHGDPRWDGIEDVDDLNPNLRDEIEHFFQVYKQLEGSKTASLGWSGIAETWPIIEAARAAYSG